MKIALVPRNRHPNISLAENCVRHPHSRDRSSYSRLVAAYVAEASAIDLRVTKVPPPKCKAIVNKLLVVAVCRKGEIFIPFFLSWKETVDARRLEEVPLKAGGP